MGLFFHVETDADKKRMEGYDEAVRLFRAEVSQFMEDTAVKNPALQKPLHIAAEALRQRPLPSEANSDENALRRMALSSLTIEMALSKLHSLGGAETVAEIASQMRETGKRTTGLPEFKALTDAAIKAAMGMKVQVAKDMEDAVLDLYIAELEKKAPEKNPRVRVDRNPRP